MDVINSEFCICCRRSLNRIGGRRRRSYYLTAVFVQNHPHLMPFLVEIENIREFREEDRICRPCFQRAMRYNGQEISADAQVEVAPDQPEDVAVNQPEDVAVNQPEDVAVNQPEDVAVNQPEDVAVNQVEDVPVNQPQNDAANQHEEEIVGNANSQDQAVQVNLSNTMISGYKQAPYNTHLCIIDGCHNRNLQRIHIDVRTVVLQEKCFYIPRGCRICEQHSSAQVWQDIDSNTRRILNTFSPTHMKDMLDVLRTRKVALNFDRLSSMTDAVFHYYIGFSKAHFQEILQNTPSIRQEFKNKAGRALATVLSKLHTGDSNERLSIIFNMSRKTLEKTMAKVRSYLLTEFVPRHLGFDHMTREEVISRCLSIPNALFGNPEAPLSERRAILILDGTYIYLQKSSNNYFQRKSYSLHKFRHLVKPFLIVCPDGHILDIYGLYSATTSDATILTEIVKCYDDPFIWFFNHDDVMILDRGFRDCVEDVESCGYRVYMPATKDENEYQLSVQKANDSRKVTMCRWVVETINGRLKNQFRQLRSRNFNVAARHLFDEIKIAASLLNAFGAPLVDHRLVDEIIHRIPLRDGNRNRLSEYVLQKNLNQKRANFQLMNADVPELNDFPQLTMDDLIIYALGTYQIEQARSYYGEHVKGGCYVIEVYKEPNLEDFREQNLDCIDPWLLRGRIQSRHHNRKKYFVNILLERGLQGPEAILGHYCSCVVGKRTLGCCSHVMSIVWFLGWGRHQEHLPPPAQFLDTIIRQDLENEVYDEPENVI